VSTPNPARVSVIVPAYNVERYLPDAVRSVRCQTWKDLELIIVDDGSTDGTGEVAERLASEDERLRVVHKPNGGLSSARNAGIRVARGEYLCFLDADDVFLPDKLQKQVSFLSFFSGCDLVYSDYYLGDHHANPNLLQCKSPPAIELTELLSYCNWLTVMCELARASLLEKIGGFDESLSSSEDWDFWIRASRCGTLSYLPGPVGVYRIHHGQMHRNQLRMRSNQRQVVRKHFPVGSPPWRVSRASMAWTDMQRAWAARRYARMTVCAAQLAWFARSRTMLRNVLRFGKY